MCLLPGLNDAAFILLHLCMWTFKSAFKKIHFIMDVTVFQAHSSQKYPLSEQVMKSHCHYKRLLISAHRSISRQPNMNQPKNPNQAVWAPWFMFCQSSCSNPECPPCRGHTSLVQWWKLSLGDISGQNTSWPQQRHRVIQVTKKSQWHAVFYLSLKKI